jgi:uncharacterized protein YbjT (DUF2867 family)
LRLAVFGATGLTGGFVVEEALAQGHEVVALVRDPSRVARRHPRLTVLGGSPVDPGDVARAVRGAEAVVHCLGIGGKGDGARTTLVSDSVKVVLAAMDLHGVRRIVCMSNVGAGGSGTWFANRVVVPLFLRWLLPIVEDKDRMEGALRASHVEWVSVRLPAIVEGPAKPLRVSDDGRGIGLTVTAGSVARFLLACVTGDAFLGRAPSIGH